ncbi:hypothetical protein [Geminocystis sp. NIES-3709]|uniref:hypothetical protein n=1 Tax=Geminocystis sp. NIES-3709 TaxID=1617448 RepID=UPI0005FC4595|nr:hypothetical protein [Geminocystis sp. NIES-3709]BAQ66006.1 hypothetical protein GM3709_2771 [Geminocystis sp. NIES-3709]
MFIYEIEDLENQGIVNLGDSELTIQGKILVKSISISKQLREMAINICQQEKLAGRVCIAIENQSYLTIWKQKIDDKLHPQKKVDSVSVKESSAKAKKIQREIISVCEKQLVKYIGPIGKFIVDDLVAENSDILAEDFIELVSQEIPDSSKRKEFRQYFANI